MTYYCLMFVPVTLGQCLIIQPFALEVAWNSKKNYVLPQIW